MYGNVPRQHTALLKQITGAPPLVNCSYNYYESTRMMLGTQPEGLKHQNRLW